MTIFSLVGEILLKDNNTKQKLEEIEGAGSKTGSTLDGAFSKIGGALLKLGAVVGVTMGFKSLFDKASAGQQTMAQMDAVLKSTGGSAGMTKEALIKLADAQSKVTTFSAGTTKAAENLLLTFTGISSKTFPDTIKAAQDMSVAMGTDLNSSVMTLGKALNNPAEGMSRLTKQGVTFTAAQKEQITAMEKAGNVAGAQAIILQELQKEFGGSATAAGSTFAGQLTILRNQLTGVGVGIVSKLLPPLTTLVTAINNHMPQIQAITTSVINGIGNAVNSAMPIIEKIIEDGIKIAESIFPNISGSAGGLSSTISGLVSGGLTVLKNVMDWLAQHGSVVQAAFIGITTAVAAYKVALLASNVAQTAHNVISTAMGIKDKSETVYIYGLIAAEKARAIATKASAVAQGALNVVMSANSIALVVIAITALVAGFVLLYNKSTTFRNFINQLWTTLKQFASSVKTDVMAVIQVVIAKFTEFRVTIITIFTAIATFFTTTWNTISNTFNTVINAIVTFVNTTFGSMINDVKILFGDFQAMFKAVWDAIENIFLGTILLILDLVTGNFNKLKSDAQSIWNNIKDDFATVWLAIKVIFITTLDLIRDTITTVWNGIKSITESLWNGLKDFLSSLWDGIKSLASSAWNSLKNAVTSIIISAVDGAKSIWNGLLSWFESLPSRLYNVGSSMFSSLKSGISSVLGTITSAVQSGFNGAINFITSLPGKAIGWGKDFINGLINGIKSMIGGVTDAVSGVADKIRSFLHFSVPDEGPLSDADTYGSDFMELIAGGITDNKFKVVDSIKSLAGDMKVDTTANITANANNKANNNVNSSKTDTPKQPIILQLVLQNAKVIAEWLIDDINQLQGSIQLNNSRLNLGRR